MNCFSLSRFALVILILLIVCWSYYAYIVEMCIIWSDNICQKVFYIIIYHILLVMFLSSYYKAVMAQVEPVPFEFYLNAGEHATSLDLVSDRDKWRRFLEEIIAKKNLTIYTRDVGSNVRFCSICQLIKPDRAHHCSLCNRCLLRMDHHCPWVGNCVGYHNHKFFIQFLGYGSLYCLFVAATVIEFAMSWWKNDQMKNMRGINFLILLVISSMFLLVQASLCGYHIYLTMGNMTTLESMRRSVFQDPDIVSFDIGKLENLKELLGDHVVSWFLPTQSSRGDGVIYPVRRKPVDYDSI